MEFDIEKSLKDMNAAASGVILDKSPQVQDCIKKALEEEKQALLNIAKARLSNQINDDDVNSQLEDEKIALEAAMLACQVKSKELAQSGANAAINSLLVSIGEAI
ncbi:hypothetical protein MNBD_GAMMA22-1674 [hydrothermal vent metagenome]|uniref:Uncharacterized protein n=1 Tax=hydrothermal vent metagenome TaxID=652676 RepID=A0A3B1A060_9ZZZZ